MEKHPRAFKKTEMTKNTRRGTPHFCHVFKRLDSNVETIYYKCTRFYSVERGVKTMLLLLVTAGFLSLPRRQRMLLAVSTIRVRA